jgi:hypothetical protein
VDPRAQQGAGVATQHPGVELTQRRYRGARLDELRGGRAAVASISHKIQRKLTAARLRDEAAAPRAAAGARRGPGQIRLIFLARPLFCLRLAKLVSMPTHPHKKTAWHSQAGFMRWRVGYRTGSTSGAALPTMSRGVPAQGQGFFFPSRAVRICPWRFVF